MLLSISVWKEVRRVSKANLVLRIIAVAIAVAALACIAIPLTCQTGQTVSDKHEAVLLTDGFNADSLKKYLYVPVFTTSSPIKKEYPTAVLLNNLAEVRADHPGITGLHILGYGLDEEEMKVLSGMPVAFHPAPQPTGISSIGWNHNLKAGEVLKVQGRFNDPENKNYLVILKGLNVTLDSVAVKTSGDFELHTTPKTAGNIVYRLIVKSGQDTLENESLPLHIGPVKPLKVLILASSPDFENRFLKNWLSANGYAVHVRTTISKDKYSTEAINAPQIALTGLSATTLQNFDVVVGDQLALQNLNSGESAALKQQVTQKGLGLIVRADSTGKNDSWFQSSFPVYRTSGQTQNSSTLVLSGQTQPTQALRLDPVNIVYKQGTQVLASDIKNRSLISAGMAGAGKVIFSTLNNTYNWMLAGDEQDYTAYWSLLIGKVARQVSVSRSLIVLNELAGFNQQINVEVLSASQPDSVTIAGVKPAFAQSDAVPFLWSGGVWSSKTGWQNVGNTTGSAGDIYVFGDNDWQTVKNCRKIFVTNRYAKENLLNYTNAGQKVHQISRQIPKIWFYLLLLAACTYLWAEAKFSVR
ncbi:hypothetical protein BEL04_11465 [Mucilaginibacter sp. PPCGB 2223]|nr:hypothetical protein BEL04_11465 [Mucilaginibacter sp. PPCGB 2223]